MVTFEDNAEVKPRKQIYWFVSGRGQNGLDNGIEQRGKIAQIELIATRRAVFRCVELEKSL